MDVHMPPAGFWQQPRIVLALWAAAAVLLTVALLDSLAMMVEVWGTSEEYSHGFFIPLISLYLLWAKRFELSFSRQWSESALGLGLLLIGLLLGVMGGLATIKTVQQYGFIIGFIGIFAAAFGKQGLKSSSMPLLFLFFMVPFPSFIMNNLSSKLQLLSSWLGVEFIRACDIMVFLEGNVIDLGGYKLQVVDACSGLRYLFPLASLSFLCAYLFKGPLWQKGMVFLSSVPLTILMNSFRIGVTGLLVNQWGTAMAEGFLHDFEGWVVFLLCMVMLFIEMWLFSRFSGRPTAFADLVQMPEEWFDSKGRQAPVVQANPAVFAVIVLVVCIGFSSQLLRGDQEIIPQRKAFSDFPAQLAGWHGRRETLEPFYLNELKLNDYLMMNYSAPGAGEVNFYIAYYDSQRNGSAIHSPRSCMPGGGWRITSLDQREFADINFQGTPLRLNRAVIEKGEYKQLVYYWFPQRGRQVSNEYLVKWYLFADAITMHRTDGALVRLVTMLDKNQDIAIADQRLQNFLRDAVMTLQNYLPGTDAAVAAMRKIQG